MYIVKFTKIHKQKLSTAPYLGIKVLCRLSDNKISTIKRIETLKYTCFHVLPISTLP